MGQPPFFYANKSLGADNNLRRRKNDNIYMSDLVQWSYEDSSLRSECSERDSENQMMKLNINPLP